MKKTISRRDALKVGGATALSGMAIPHMLKNQAQSQTQLQFQAQKLQTSLRLRLGLRFNTSHNARKLFCPFA